MIAAAHGSQRDAEQGSHRTDADSIGITFGRGRRLCAGGFARWRSGLNLCEAW